MGVEGRADGSSIDHCWRSGAPRPVSSSDCGTASASTQPEAGEPLSAPPTAPRAEDRLGRALEFTRGRNVVRFEFFTEAMHAMIWLGGELANVHTWLKVEDRRLAREWHRLKVPNNLGQLRHD